MTYPTASPCACMCLPPRFIFGDTLLDNLRSCCDLINILFVLDDCTDALEGESVKEICEATMDALLNPNQPRPEGENLIGEMVRQ